MNPLLIYYWGQADTIIAALQIISTVVSIVGLVSYLFGVEEFHSIIPVARKLMISGILGLFVSVFLPSSKTTAAMVVIPAIIESKAIQQDLPEIYNAAVDALKAQLKDSKAEK
jgi:FtsH-binding integral membrane protein